MTRSQRRLAAFVLFLPLLLAGLATFYVVAMDRLEGKRRSFWKGLEWAAGALSTTGFGPDVSWSHPAMVVVVALVQFAGVFLLFLLVPILLIPFLDERFGRRPISAAIWWSSAGGRRSRRWPNGRPTRALGSP